MYEGCLIIRINSQSYSNIYIKKHYYIPQKVCTFISRHSFHKCFGIYPSVTLVWNLFMVLLLVKLFKVLHDNELNFSNTSHFSNFTNFNVKIFSDETFDNCLFIICVWGSWCASFFLWIIVQLCLSICKFFVPEASLLFWLKMFSL